MLQAKFIKKKGLLSTSTLKEKKIMAIYTQALHFYPFYSSTLQIEISLHQCLDVHMI